jgi:hypothetical protein
MFDISARHVRDRVKCAHAGGNEDEGSVDGLLVEDIDWKAKVPAAGEFRGTFLGAG